MVVGDNIEHAKGVDIKPLFERLLDMEQTISLKVLGKHIFSSEKSWNNQRMVMRYFERLTKQRKMKHVPEFISDNRDEDAIKRQFVNLEQEIEDESLEKYANKELEVFEAKAKGELIY